MKKLVIALLMVLVLPIVALAQDAETPAEETVTQSSQGGVNYAKRSFGNFSLDLPTHGTLKTPASSDWDEEEQVVFNWFGDEDDPIVLIQCRVDSFEGELGQDAYNIFCDTLLSNWLNEEDNFTVLDPPAPRMEGDPRRTRSQLGTHVWNLIQIDDHSDANGGRIYYSIFCTYSGTDIYTISFYYLQPMSKENPAVKEFGKPLLENFRIAGEQSTEEEWIEAEPADAA